MSQETTRPLPRPLPSLDWNRVTWSAPDERPIRRIAKGRTPRRPVLAYVGVLFGADGRTGSAFTWRVCSYCGDDLDEDEVALMTFGADTRTAIFCEMCQVRHWAGAL